MIDPTQTFVETGKLIYLVGAQKSGTTTLYDRFISHPDVYVQARKEVHYCDCVRAPYLGWHGMVRGPHKDYSKMYLSNPDDHTEYMRNLAEGAPAGAAILDFTPAYALCSASTFEEMAMLHRETWFLFVMRDPVDRLWSGLRHRFRRFIENGEMGQDELNIAFDRALAHLQDPDHMRSRYDLTLDALNKAALPDRTIVMSFEDMLAGGWKTAISRCGLNPDCLPDAVAKNRGVGESLALDQVRRARAVDVFRPAYDAAAKALGGLPDNWHGSAEVLEEAK